MAEAGDVPFHIPDAAAIETSQLTVFARHCATAVSRPELATSYEALHRFSVDEAAVFWRLWLEWTGIQTEGDAEPVITGDSVETASFFPRLRLSWPEALLAPLAGPDGSMEDDDLPAILGRSEEGRATRITRGELRRQVRRLAASLDALGVASGDRVLGVARNQPEAIVACLAATSLGASWSAVAPDMGLHACTSRAMQLQPTWLFANGEYHFQGRRLVIEDKLVGLLAALPSVKGVVALDGAVNAETLSVPVHSMAGLIESAPAEAEVARSPLRPFDHPLFVLFSSGTTGPPKCIVHGHGGTLIEHLKELRLHCDLGPGDVLYFHTTAAWMMWNWLASALATGCAIAVYDGSVTHPEQDALLTLVADLEVTHFGTSPAYLRFCDDAGLTVPRLPALKGVMSTGSILYERQYDYVREHLGTAWVQSISGGTDIVGCFVLGNPNLPVYRGDSQSVSLGYDVRVAVDGQVHRTGTGELVVVSPFPSRPVGLFGDTTGERFHAAYFSGPVAGAWVHGDFVTLTQREGGTEHEGGRSARILGRSDGVLNIRGVRIGPAELYSILDSLDEVVETMAIDQPWPRAIGGRRLVLLVVLHEGITLDRPLTLRMKKQLKQRGSMNHVPAVIRQVAELPRTLNGKRSERSAADTLARRPVRNLAALANPECLDVLRSDPELLPE